MSLLTPFLKLFKWDTTNETDLESEFNIDKSMNENWDKLDTKAQEHENKILDIENNIENIQTKDTEQDKLIQKLKDNCINVTTDEATSLQVQDASTLPAKLDVRGNHSQETREGYNLWDYLNVVKASAGGLTIEKDYENGYITVNGTPNANYIYISSSIIITDMLEDGQRYTLWQEVYASEGITDGIYMQVTRTADNEENIKYYSRNNLATFKVDKSNNASYSITLQTSSVDGTGTLTNYRNRYMLYKGTDEKSYELPGASPSLDYPSPVRAVGDNVNMFNVWESGTISNSGNIESSDIAIRTADFISVKSNTSYTYKIYDETISNIALFEYDENSNFIKVMYNLNTEQTIVTSETTRKVKMRIVSTDLSTKMKFEEGTEATSYSPYGQGSVEVRKLTENVIDLSKAIALYNTEITEIDEENGIIKVHRTNTQDPSIQIFCNLPAGQYTMLHNSHNFGQVSVYGKNKIVDIGSEKYKIFNATENITDIRIYSGSELPTDYEINFSDIILVAGNVPREDIKYTKYQEQSYILDIQKPMLQGDYFVKETDGWKEVHTFGYVNTREVENLAVSLNTSNGDFRRYSVDLKINNRKSGEYLKMLCTHFKYTDSRWHEYEGICGWESGQTFCIGTFNKELDTAEKMKNYLLNNDVEIYYELAEQEELDLTEEQKEVLQQLNNLDLFKGTNNIYTEQDLALLQLDYTVDTKMYIDNKIANTNAQVLNM